MPLWTRVYYWRKTFHESVICEKIITHMPFVDTPTGYWNKVFCGIEGKWADTLPDGKRLPPSMDTCSTRGVTWLKIYTFRNFSFICAVRRCVVPNFKILSSRDITCRCRFPCECRKLHYKRLHLFIALAYFFFHNSMGQ